MQPISIDIVYIMRFQWHRGTLPGLLVSQEYIGFDTLQDFHLADQVFIVSSHFCNIATILHSDKVLSAFCSFGPLFPMRSAVLEFSDSLVGPLYQTCNLGSLLTLSILGFLGLQIEILELLLCQLVFQVVIL
jgi:hypothetical protein